MTTTIAFGNAADAFLKSTNATYSTARTGSGISMLTGNIIQFGQYDTGSTYEIYQGFIAFTYTIPTNEVVTTALIRTVTSGMAGASTARNTEYRSGYSWTPSGATSADWRDHVGLPALSLMAWVPNSNGAGFDDATLAGSDELVTSVESGTSQEYVVCTSRQRVGNVPTAAEYQSFWSTDASGTADDPQLIICTVPRSQLWTVMGAQVMLSDGSWAFLESTGGGTPVVTLKRCTEAGVVTTLATLPLGTGATDFAYMRGAQGYGLAVDSADNLYVAGKVGNAENSLAVKGYTKSGGTWTATTTRVAALPAYDTAVNQVAITWHSTAGGTLVALAGHLAGAGYSGDTDNVVAYALLSSAYVASGSGTFLRSSGSATIAGILPPVTDADLFNSYTNEVGSGLDVVAAGASAPTWGYVASFIKGQVPGENGETALGRYILNAAGSGLDHASGTRGLGWGTKDANAKVRVVPISSTVAAHAATDADTGWGITVHIQQHTGTTTGSVRLGSVALGDESIASMPLPSVLTTSSAWDILYNSVENRLWVYYVSASNSRQVMRTAIDLNTYQAVRNEVTVGSLVGAAGETIQGIRVQRNVGVTQKALVTVAHKSSGAVLATTRVVDQFNLAPTEPTLTVRANYDATAAATFAWTFNDPNPGDTQSAYQLQIDRTDTNVTVVDTGKVASTTSSRNVTGGTLTNGLSYRWRVRTYDALDVVSPWSSYGTFQTSAGGTVTITNPAADNPAGVITDNYVVSWSVSGTTQASYRVRVVRTDTAAQVSDTGYLTSTATSHEVTGMVTDVEHQVQVTVRNAALVVSGTGLRLITPSYGTPEVPALTLEGHADDGYLLVSVTNPIPQGDRPEVTRNDILRRVSGSTGAWEVVGTAEPDGTFRDYTAASGVTYEYRARGQA